MSKNESYAREIADIMRERNELAGWFRNRFMSLFASSLEWKGFTLEEKRFIVRQLWAEGKIGAVKTSTGIYFTRVAGVGLNLYGSPTDAQAITLMSERFISSAIQQTDNVNLSGTLGKGQIVIGHALPTLIPIEQAIKPWVDDLVDTEMALRTNAKEQNLSIAIEATQNNERKLRELVKRMMLGAHDLVIGVDEIESIKALMTGVPYLLDKLEERKDHLEKEVLTFLGVDNLKEKPERMQGDEINANNNEININQESILENLQDWVSRLNKEFGSSYSIEAKRVTASIYEEGGKESEDASDIAVE